MNHAEVMTVPLTAGRFFPGLDLAVEALLAGDLAEVLAVLQQGLQTPEHAAFVRYSKSEEC